MKLSELAKALGAELVGEGDPEITGIADILDAGPGQITFAADEKYFRELEHSKATAVIMPHAAPAQHVPVLRVKNPKIAFAQALTLLRLKPYESSGINARAVIGRDAVLGSDLSIHPYAVVAEGAKIGDRVTLYPGVYVGHGSVIGDDCILYPNVSIREGIVIGKRAIIHSGTAIGSDGFGYVTDGGKHHKIPQVGGVIIEDDVEIGANCTIDRATLGNTLIKKGTKIDNMVHIAHNVKIGEHCLLIAQAGIAGSTTLGNWVVLGGQVGVADHVTIGDRVMVASRGGIIRDTESDQVMGGFFAMPQRDWLKVQSILPKLPELKRMIAALERQVQELKLKGEQS